LHPVQVFRPAQLLSALISTFGAGGVVATPDHSLGVGGWSIFYYNEDVLRYPHDFLLEVGAEQGAIGLIPLIALLVLLLRSALRVLRSDHGACVLHFDVGVLYLLSSVTGTVESRQLWFICGIDRSNSTHRPVSGLMTYAAKPSRKPNRQETRRYGLKSR